MSTQQIHFGAKIPTYFILKGENAIDFLPFLYLGRQLLSLSVCYPAHQAPSEKGSTIK